MTPERRKNLRGREAFAVASEILLKEQLIGPADLDEARQVQRQRGGRLLEILVAEGKVSYRQVVETISRRLGIPFLERLTADMVDMAAFNLLTPEQCRVMAVVPLRFTPTGSLCFALSDPTDLGKVDDMRFITGKRVEPVLVLQDHLAATLAELAPEPGHIDVQLKELQSVSLEIQETVPETVHDISELDYNQAPVIGMANLVLKQAILAGASDIHVEPKSAHVRLRYRIDGVLCEKDPLPLRYRAALITRLKVLARLDIAEKRQPQDGAFTVIVEGKRVDFRVSTFPSVQGEKVVLRILDKSNIQLGIEDLSFADAVAQSVRDIMKCHEGFFLVTGPTGSGKSTTLYTLLREIDSRELNITTLEDPVEYQVETLTQGQTNVKAGFTFATGLRAILRQDPDVVLVGEIRDLETARTAVQAALTGHMVFSTLHTNSALEAHLRLQEMGLEAFLLVAAMRGALAQRLVRRLCAECREEYKPSRAISKEFTARGVRAPRGKPLYRAVGCKACNGIGYRGRIGIYELFRMTETTRRLVANGSSTDELRTAARADGYRTLLEDGLEKVKAGVTTLEEVYRVT